MSFNEQEGTCSCTLRRSSLTQDLAREVSNRQQWLIQDGRAWRGKL
ncbi:hypothetical protein TIFTF001_051756 [Ficus carica]|uniref:Uncharacterized protein n=1 Tax=Ficus carica TaxID=3494 RepID=A0AA87ZCJ6_FICCA|nr:hypothetical protein TIFTF001_051756 [Ficus carica]